MLGDTMKFATYTGEISELRNGQHGRERSPESEALYGALMHAVASGSPVLIQGIALADRRRFMNRIRNFAKDERLSVKILYDEEDNPVITAKTKVADEPEVEEPAEAEAEKPRRTRKAKVS